jgi:hypothetical protein
VQKLQAVSILSVFHHILLASLCSEKPADGFASICGGGFFRRRKTGATSNIGNGYGPSPLARVDSLHDGIFNAAMFHAFYYASGQGLFRCFA